MLKIIDVSENNGVINWLRVKGQVDGAIIRIGYRGYGSAGTLVVDNRMHEYMRGAINQGIPVGAYWLSQAVSDAEAKAEAQFIHTHLRGYDLQLPVFLDSEWGEYQGGTGRADRLSKARRTQYHLTLLRALRDMGYRTGLYTGNSWFQTEMDGEAIRRDGHTIWIASVENVRPTVSWDGWQHSWKGRVNGINTDVDMSQFNEGVLDLTKEQVLQIIAEYEAEKAKKTVSSYARQAWQEAKQAGVMDGTMPQGDLTREQFAVVLKRLGLLK